jgi:hypothetical protein
MYYVSSIVQHKRSSMNPYLATLLTFLIVLAFLRLMYFFALLRFYASQIQVKL